MKALVRVTAKRHCSISILVRPFCRHIGQSYARQAFLPYCSHRSGLPVNSRYFSSDVISSQHNDKDAQSSKQDEQIEHDIDHIHAEPTQTNTVVEEKDEHIAKRDVDDDANEIEMAPESVELELTELHFEEGIPIEPETDEKAKKVSVIPGVGMMTNPNKPEPDTQPEPEPKPEPETETEANLSSEELVSDSTAETAEQTVIETVDTTSAEPAVDIIDKETPQPITETEHAATRPEMTATEAESSSVAETESESVTKMEDTMAMQSNAEAVEEQKKRERAETEEEPEEPEAKAESQSFWMRCVAFWKAKLTPSLDWWLHFGNGLAICSMLMQEMLPLRCFLVAANACAFVFYQKQTPPLKVPSMWSIFFLCGHSVMIIRLLLENRKVDLTDIEHEVYINAFQQYGFSPIQFKKIVRYADIRRLDAGDVICYEGKPKSNTMYVLGVAELTQNETVVGGIINGFVGDLLPPESNKKAQEELKKFREKKLIDMEQKLMDSMVQHQIIPEPVSAEKAAESEEATKSEEAEQKQEPEQETDEASTTDKAAVGTDEGKLESETENESEEKKAITINDDDVVPEIKTKEEEKKKAEHVFLETLKEGIKERMEFHDPDIWNHTVVALEQSTLLVWKREELHKLMSADPRLKQAAILAFAGDLSYKLKTDKKFNMLRTYKEMLEMAMCDYTIDAGEKARLDKFREENGISSTEHEACVKGLGWSMEEFDSGVKHTESYGEKLRNWYYLNWTAKHQTGQ